MKRFLFGRLYGQDKDFDFYIPPATRVASLRAAIANDLIPHSTKLLFLQNREGVVTFGVREQLKKTDYFGRKRCNFMGYQTEAHESPEQIPFFNELSAKFPVITREAHSCHTALDHDHQSGGRMTDMQTRFDAGFYQTGNDWDEAVMTIQRNPGSPVLMMFDERGSRLELSHELSADSPARHVITLATEPVPANPSGIVSSVTLSDHERTVVPPLDLGTRPKKRGFVSRIWKVCTFQNDKDSPPAPPPASPPLPPPEPL